MCVCDSVRGALAPHVCEGLYIGRTLYHRRASRRLVVDASELRVASLVHSRRRYLLCLQASFLPKCFCVAACGTLALFFPLLRNLGGFPCR